MPPAANFPMILTEVTLIAMKIRLKKVLKHLPQHSLNITKLVSSIDNPGNT